MQGQHSKHVHFFLATFYFIYCQYDIIFNCMVFFHFTELVRLRFFLLLFVSFPLQNQFTFCDLFDTQFAAKTHFFFGINFKRWRYLPPKANKFVIENSVKIKTPLELYLISITAKLFHFANLLFHFASFV